jgi:uncharacterized protein DUF6282
MARVDLTGAVDLHVHFGPDAHRERSVTAVDAARDAAAAGHAALVLKSHDYPTSAVASVVDDLVPGVRAFGGICCDNSVGGMNPAAVEVALRLGAKIVWLPTLTSRQDFDSGIMGRLGLSGEPVDVCDDKGELLPPTREVLKLVEEYEAVLATGHVSRDEHFAVARARRAVRVLVTHAMEPLAGPNLSIEDCVALADLGATIEVTALTCLGAMASRPIEDIVACVRAVGPERCTLATDYGQKANPRPADGFQAFADALAAAGIEEKEIRTMACTVPCRLLGLAS